jgi:hypothetical protein
MRLALVNHKVPFQDRIRGCRDAKVIRSQSENFVSFNDP